MERLPAARPRVLGSLTGRLTVVTFVALQSLPL